MKKFLDALVAIQPLSEGCRKALLQKTVVLQLPKHHMLLEAARVSDCVYFLESGFAMAYTYIRGKKHIEKLFAAGEFIMSPRSLFERLPAMESIELLEAGDVLHLNYGDLMALLNDFPEAGVTYRVAMNRYYEQFRTRIHDLQLLSAIERYEKLLEDYPGIGQLLPMEQIATYLGIAPQHLSRIRKI